MYEDKTLVCKECGKEFVFTAGEQEFYAERGFQNEPQRCKACRDARKNAARGPREYFTAVCAACGGEAKVPFEPKSDRPVYCSDCFAKMRENGVEYFVVKNTLARFAAKNAGLDELCDVLEGTTSIAICEGDPVAAAKVVAEFSKKLAAQEKFVIKSGFVDGKVISVDEVKALADLPSREVLVATVLGTLIAPVRGLATVLDANISGLARVMQAIADQKGA